MSCEAYYTEAELIDGIYCPIHTGKPVTQLKEENYFFRLSRYQQRLIDWIENEPEVITPEGKRNEVLGFLRQGLDDVSITRTSFDVGCARAVGRGSRLLRLVRRAHQLRDGDRLRHRRRELREVVAVGASPHRQGDHPLSLCVLAGDADGSRGRPTPSHPRPRLAAARRREVEQDRARAAKLTDIAPARLVADFGVDGFRYHFLRDTPFGPDGDFSYERVVDRTTATSPTTSATCCRASPLSSTRSAAVSVPRRALTVRCARLPRGVQRDGGGVGARTAVRRARRDMASHPRDQRAARSDRTVEGRARPRGRRRARRCARSAAHRVDPRVAGHPDASAEIWRRIGLDGAPNEPGLLPQAARWGGYPGGLPVEKGKPLFPRISA